MALPLFNIFSLFPSSIGLKYKFHGSNIRHLGVGLRVIIHKWNDRCHFVIVTILYFIVLSQHCATVGNYHRSCRPSALMHCDTVSGAMVLTYIFCRSIFIRLAVVASRKCEVAKNSEKIWTHSSSTSSKVIDLGANRKRVCNFLLVSHCD